jgi:hypothetical protein
MVNTDTAHAAVLRDRLDRLNELEAISRDLAVLEYRGTDDAAELQDLRRRVDRMILTVCRQVLAAVFTPDRAPDCEHYDLRLH